MAYTRYSIYAVARKNIRFFWATSAHRVALMSISAALSKNMDMWLVASALCGVPVYDPAFAATHCAYRQRECQAELT